MAYFCCSDCEWRKYVADGWTPGVYTNEDGNISTDEEDEFFFARMRDNHHDDHHLNIQPITYNVLISKKNEDYQAFADKGEMHAQWLEVIEFSIF